MHIFELRYLRQTQDSFREFWMKLMRKLIYQKSASPNLKTIRITKHVGQNYHEKELMSCIYIDVKE